MIAQIGSRKMKRLSISLLIDVSELPGEGWNLSAERKWRTGAWGRPRNAITDRAHQASLFTAFRSFENKREKRWVWSAITPVTTEEDAALLTPKLQDLVDLRTDRSSHLTSDIRMPSGVLPDRGNWWIRELVTDGNHGHGTMRCVGSNVRDVVWIVGCSELGQGWEWSEVAEVGMLQAGVIQDRHLR